MPPQDGNQQTSAPLSPSSLSAQSNVSDPTQEVVDDTSPSLQSFADTPLVSATPISGGGVQLFAKEETVPSAEAHEKHIELVAHLSNQLRIKKSEISANIDETEGLKREYTHLEEERHHVDQDIRRVEGELESKELHADKLESNSKKAQLGIRDKELELKKRSDEELRLTREIAKCKQEIAEKEKRMAVIKEENRAVTKSREDLRKKVEIEVASARSKTSKAHERQILIQREKQDLARKLSEVQHKKIARADRFHTAEDNKRDLLRLEADARHIEQEIRRNETELRSIEAEERKELSLSVQHNAEIRGKETSSRKSGDEVVKLEREVERQKQVIGEKEKKIAETKSEGEEFKKAKEELRRQYELEHFGANTEFAQASEKKLQLERFKQEYLRKEKEMTINREKQAELKHELLFLEQDVATLEAELRRSANS